MSDRTTRTLEGPRVRFPRPSPGKLDTKSAIEGFAHRMMYSVAKSEHTATPFDVYQALAFAVRDRLMDRWFQTQDTYYRSDAKRIYYLSMEFLMGRALGSNILNLGAWDPYQEAMAEFGYDLDLLLEKEWDAGLGNGGLGRLAACFLDSAATLSLPFYGYGIRYEYGIFVQRIKDGEQAEAPDNWLRYGNAWEIPRPDSLYPVKFYGSVRPYRDEAGHERIEWVDTEDVMAMAYDTPIAGFRNGTVNSLRLWSAKSTRDFDLAKFNAGEYVHAVEDKNQTENISKVLYPADDRYAGKELRLKQQYFFVSATLQDVIRRFRKRAGRRWEELPDKVAIQLNDTHPAVAIPELMRVLVDQEHVGWDLSWELTQKVFGYTNHTILPEALEKWPAEFFGKLLPRHLQIIEEIDRRFRAKASARWPGEDERIEKMAILSGGETPTVHMANLAIVGSHSVNGVARLHTEILKARTFADFHELYPGRFNNKTNGITPRRWLAKCNPALSKLITEAIGEGWMKELGELEKLESLVEDPAFRARWSAVKRLNKVALVDCVRRHHGLLFDPDALFDCQVKRIHEYKRQLLNVLHVVAAYHRIHDGFDSGPPRIVMFAGKAAPSYFLAKLIIRLIHGVAGMVNGDPKMKGRLQVAFVPNYGVSAAEKIFPACELSEQISTAGTEASGTGNMKAALNGALTIGTLDGANVEIRDEVGPANIFIFGHTSAEVSAIEKSGYDPVSWIDGNAELPRVIETLGSDELSGGDAELYRPIVELLTGRDRYLHCADFASYLECQTRVGETYLQPEDWVRMSIRNVAGMGRFSSDRTVREYAAEIWNAQPVPVKLDEPEV